LKLITASLKASATGSCPDWAAGTAGPAPTVRALSLKGLQRTKAKVFFTALN